MIDKKYTEEEARKLVEQSLEDIHYALKTTYGKDSEKYEICVSFIVSVLERMNQNRAFKDSDEPSEASPEPSPKV